jgi:predicted CopG family antitoxin
MKNITVSDEAYLRLKSLKKPRESFTELIGRIAGQNAFLELAGVLTPTEGRSMKKAVERARRGTQT